MTAIHFCDTMSYENPFPASYDACIECTVSQDVRAEVIRFTVHMDITMVCAAFFNMCTHVKTNFTKNRRTVPSAAPHVRTLVRIKKTSL